MRAEGIEPEKDRATQMPPNNSLIMGEWRVWWRYAEGVRPDFSVLPSVETGCIGVTIRSAPLWFRVYCPLPLSMRDHQKIARYKAAGEPEAGRPTAAPAIDRIYILRDSGKAFDAHSVLARDIDLTASPKNCELDDPGLFNDNDTANLYFTVQFHREGVYRLLGLNFSQPPQQATASVDRTLASWAAIRDLAPPAMRQFLSDSLLESLAPDYGGATDAPSKRFRTVLAHASEVKERKAALAIERLGSEGLVACLNEIFTSYDDAERRASILERIGNNCGDNWRDALLFYWLAYGSDPAGARAGRIGCKMFNLGDIGSAAALVRLGDISPRTTAVGELELAERLLGRLESSELIPAPVTERDGARLSRTHPKVAYVASSVQPWSNVGYTIRTHELLRGLVSEGIDVECVVRPGYPWDRMAIENGDAVQELSVLDGVRYHCRRLGGVEMWGAEFIEKSAQSLAAQFETLNINIVHAASNNRNALPALMAARRLGLPFVYEVRGLWELTAASKKSWWEETERYALDRDLEHLIATESDHVFVITGGRGRELIDRGLPPGKLSLLPNAVDPQSFAPANPSPLLVAQYGREQSDLTLVYAGSLMVYEGMDDVVAAIALLREHGLRVDFLLIGAGPALSDLQKQVADLGLDGQVQFLGPKPPDEVQGLLALADAVALPRKAFRVCRIVSPLKPFEAMSMGKPVILSDLPVSREIVEDGVTGLICRPDDPRDLAAKLESLARDAGLRTRLGASAREWILRERTWAANAQFARRTYEGLLRGENKSVSNSPIAGRTTKAIRSSTTSADERLN